MPAPRAELTERKRAIDKHTNLATALLGAIKARGLDRFYEHEEELVGGKGSVEGVLKMLGATAPGTPSDHLRLALIWLLTAETAPSEAEFERVECALRESGAELAPWLYVRRMRRMNLTGRQQVPSVAEGLSSFGAAPTQITSLLGSTFGQGLSSLTKGKEGAAAAWWCGAGGLSSRGAFCVEWGVTGSRGLS